MDTTNTYPTRLDRVLSGRGSTTAWLAGELGKDRRTVGAWRRGDRPIPKTAGIAIAAVLGVELSDVWEPTP